VEPAASHAAAPSSVPVTADAIAPSGDLALAGAGQA
jgi:hypothetical protein